MNVVIQPLPTAPAYSEYGGEDGTEYPTFGLGETNHEAEAAFLCAWGDFPKLVKYFCGDVSYAGGGMVLLTQPALYDFALHPALVGMGARVRPYTYNPVSAAGNTAIQIKPDKALVIIRFGCNQSQADHGRLFSEVFNPSAEFLTCAPKKSGQLYWPDGTIVSAQQLPPFVYRKREWVYTHNWAPVNYASYVDPGYYVGCVNAAALTSPTTGEVFATKTVLYMGPQFSEDRLPSGLPALKVHHHFLIADYDWNTFPHVDAGGTGMTFDKQYLDKALSQQFVPYPTPDAGADLSDLLLIL